MATNLTSDKLTIADCEITPEILKSIGFYVPKDYTVGDVVWLDGIECVVIATNTQMGDYHLAVDRKHDLGYYCRYIGQSWYDSGRVSRYNVWVYGGYGTPTETYKEIGGGMSSTNNYLSQLINCTNGSATVANFNCPLLYQGLTDFRNAHKTVEWFVPTPSDWSLISAVKSELSLDGYGAASKDSEYWTIYKGDDGTYAETATINSGGYGTLSTNSKACVRLCCSF